MNKDYRDFQNIVEEQRKRELGDALHLWYCILLLLGIMGITWIIGVKSEVGMIIFSVAYYFGFALLAKVGATPEVFRDRIKTFYFSKANFSVICLGIFDLSLIGLWLLPKSNPATTQTEMFQRMIPTPIEAIGFITLNMILVGTWFWLRKKYISK